MNKELATEKHFRMAPDGHRFTDVCRYCFQDTGNIVVKNKRTIVSLDPSAIPRYISSAESVCDLCLFLSIHVNEFLETKEGESVLDERCSSWGCGVLVERKNGEEQYICFVPFSADKGVVAAIEGGGRVKFKHGMKVLCTQDQGAVTMCEILDEGEDIYINFGAGK